MAKKITLELQDGKFYKNILSYIRNCRIDQVEEVGQFQQHFATRKIKNLDRGGLFRIRELRHTLFRQKATVSSNLTLTKRQLKRGHSIP
jgi:hypothetical protein